MNRTTPDAKIIVLPPAREIRNLEHRIERLVQAIVDPDTRDKLHTSAVAIRTRGKITSVPQTPGEPRRSGLGLGRAGGYGPHTKTGKVCGRVP